MSNDLLDLPEGWELVKLGDICNVQGGYAFKSSDYQENGIPLLRISNIINKCVSFNSDTVYLNPTYEKTYQDFLVEKGDIVIALSGATTGKYGIYTENDKALLNQRVGRLKFFNCSLIIPYYIFYYTEIIKEIILIKAYGAAQPNISTNNLAQFKIPLPPLNEQKRIVAKIEELNDRSQTAQKALETIPQLCDRFRQSVLAAAFRGDLTADWREKNPDVEPASVLLERIHNTKFQPSIIEYKRELPGNWIWSKFADIAAIKSNLVSPSDYLEFPHIAPNHIVSNTGELLEFTTIQEDKVTSPKHLFEPGQILYSKIRPYLAKAVLVNFSGLCSADMYPISSFINSSFLHHWIICPEFTEMASNQQGRTVLPKINQVALNQLLVPVPPSEEQKQIVSLIEKYFKIIETIEKQHQQTTEKLEKLNQSILSKAFRGELVPQDPDDEPASVLLERIRAEREKLNNNKPKSTSKRKGKTPKEQGTIPGLE
ncbi:restriction endonuclease subunit S [Cuspidothrix issatschenkoi LEGE 03284]|uniref:restriction endonuclease subunit S n=1 Tax=Cuspidothrix issatschenkoi TaxID=230752 RepID=UPI00187FBADA|nr:restriction endonuclease subunit S [Cuspidothrix issatschenkoi]MBE9231986.1 restriction endonuclease subunit S [Cuspidothrix issatschenkoi LEGE 03284]